MTRRRVQFCGSIAGTVAVGAGETDEQAIERANARLLDILDRRAKNFGLGDGHGPNLQLEAD